MFELTTLEARKTAIRVRQHYLKRKFAVRIERAAWTGAPYRTTLLCVRKGERVLVECQGSLDYHRALKGLQEVLARERRPAELYIAVETSPEVSISPSSLRQMDKDGVGLLLVDQDGSVATSAKACNWAYFACPEPTLKFGGLRKKVDECFQKYNRVNRLDGMRDLSSLVEGETRRLAELAQRRGALGTKPIRLDKMDWSGWINVLASKNVASPGLKPVIDETLKNDLHSFRGGRNLADHPARTSEDAHRLAIQCHDRMSLGARLLAEVDSARRSLAARGVPAGALPQVGRQDRTNSVARSPSVS
jgi:hypothetical protein